MLLLTMHHIVSDGWSMGILFRELSVLYEAFSGGRVRLRFLSCPSNTPTLPGGSSSGCEGRSLRRN